MDAERVAAWPDPDVPEGWPNVDYEKEPWKSLVAARYQARLDDVAAKEEVRSDAIVVEEGQEWEAFKAGVDAEIALFKAIHDARVEVAKGAIDRGQSGAEFVRNAAAAIATIYTGLAGLVFGKEAFAKEPGAVQFPTVGLIPALFLGFSLGAAAFYVAYLTRSPALAAPRPSSSYRVLAERRVNTFVDWASQIALNRIYFLHAAVLSLTFGVIFLPIAFTQVASRTAWIWALLAALATLVVPLLTLPSPSGSGPVTTANTGAKTSTPPSTTRPND